jgi:hypothetical protein
MFEGKPPRCLRAAAVAAVAAAAAVAVGLPLKLGSCGNRLPVTLNVKHRKGETVRQEVHKRSKLVTSFGFGTALS